MNVWYGLIAKTQVMPPMSGFDKFFIWVYKNKVTVKRMNLQEMEKLVPKRPISSIFQCLIKNVLFEKKPGFSISFFPVTYALLWSNCKHKVRFIIN